MVPDSSINSMDATYVCPSCKNTLEACSGGYKCTPCGILYAMREGIPVFTMSEEYWCNVGKSTMAKVINEAIETGQWRSAMNNHIPHCARHIEPLYRGDAQFVFPMDSSATVLDAGSMWGGITVPVARYCKQVYALDKTWETLRFLEVRSKQLGLANIKPVVSGIHSLPFPDNFFDCVILNGVLEWLGIEQDVVLEKHWSGKQDERSNYEISPEKMQLQALRELFRVIKPQGSIYVAIENRIGIQYFLGHPDDHVNIRFASLLPRKIANWLTNWKRNSDYRTYTYTPSKLSELVGKAGFQNRKVYSVHPHYNTIARLVPLDVFDELGNKSTDGDVPLSPSMRVKMVILSKLWGAVPKLFRKQLAPSLALIATKSSDHKPVPRLIRTLVNVDVIAKNEQSHMEVIVANNRFDDKHVLVYWIYDSNREEISFFCKISRTGSNEALAQESEMLRIINTQFYGTELQDTIPELLYFGEADGVPIQVCSYVEGKNAHGSFGDILRRLDNLLPMSNCLPNKFVATVKSIGLSKWIKSSDPIIKKSIKWLAEFQTQTQVKKVDIGEFGPIWVDQQVESIRQSGLLQGGEIDEAIRNLKKDLSELKGINVPVSVQHGDFDVCNLLVKKNGICVTDFEHAAPEALPFFDLGNLLLNPLLLEYKSRRDSLFLNQHPRFDTWEAKIVEWSCFYAQEMGFPVQVMSLLPALTVLEQNGKKYPSTRDPYDYPLYGEPALRSLLNWRLSVSNFSNPKAGNLGVEKDKND